MRLLTSLNEQKWSLSRFALSQMWGLGLPVILILIDKDFWIAPPDVYRWKHIYITSRLESFIPISITFVKVSKFHICGIKRKALFSASRLLSVCKCKSTKNCQFEQTLFVNYCVMWHCLHGDVLLYDAFISSNTINCICFIMFNHYTRHSYFM